MLFLVPNVNALSEKTDFRLQLMLILKFFTEIINSELLYCDNGAKVCASKANGICDLINVMLSF